MTRISYAETPLIQTLIKCKSTIRWLSEAGPVNLQDIPREHEQKIQELDKLAIVFKRNNRTVELRRQRLRRVLEQESHGLTHRYRMSEFVERVPR